MIVKPCLNMDESHIGALTISVYPNPAKTDLFYKLNLNAVHKYFLPVHNGTVLEEGEQRGTEARLDLSPYPPGIYNLTIKICKNTKSKSFLIE